MVILKSLAIEVNIEGNTDDNKVATEMSDNLKGFFNSIEGGFKDSPAYIEGYRIRVIVKEIF